MANDLIQRKYYIVDTEDSLPSEIVDGSIYYVKSNNALYIDMSSTRRRINPDYSNKLDANQGYINAGKSLSIDDNGNIIPVENINIDPTLKNQGQAADAKITGQALGELYDYFEGLQQIIENLDDSTAVSTDTTLSNQGVPADAKATGDRLDSMQSELNVLEPTATASDIGKTLKVKTVANGKVSKYELGDMMIDNTLTQTGWAADAKKVGSELSSVKDEVRNESQARTTADNALREDINDDLAQIQAQISSVYGAPSTASTVAQMTDHTKAYVYTGEESGYVTGNWYYWNGSSWVSGGVYNAVAIQTDKSLTLDGKAADAKTVGDELNDLKDDLNYVNNDLFNCTPLTYTNGYGIDLTTNPVDLTPFESDRLKYAIIECNAGDEFLINAKGLTRGRAYGFIDSSNVPILIADANADLSHYYVSAPPNAAKLVINDDSDGVCYKISKRLDDLNTSVNGKVAKQQLLADAGKILIVGDDGLVTTSNFVDGLTDEAKDALLNCFAHVAWTDEHGKNYYDALAESLGVFDIYNTFEWNYLRNGDGNLKIIHRSMTSTNVDTPDSGQYGVFVSDDDVVVANNRRSVCLTRGRAKAKTLTAHIPVDFYPIPIPPTASRIKYQVLPTDMEMYVYLFKYLGNPNAEFPYIRLANWSWATGEQTKTFTPDINLFISTMIRRTDNEAFTEEPEVSIVFEE